MKKISALISAALIGTMATNAIPAKRVYRTLTQPDGTTITVMPVGDEHAHYFVTSDGVAMTKDNDGFLHPANKEMINALTSHAKERRISRRTETSPGSRADISTGSKYHGLGHFSEDFPRTGKIKVLVFLVEYTDVKFKTPDPKNYFSRQLNQEGFSENKGTGSARDYFLAQSGGLFDPEFEVLGPIKLAHDMAYYGANDYWGNDQAPEQMVIEAVKAMDGQIDYSQYDFNNDGKIDNVFVIYAGYGEADYDDENTVWPHNFEIRNGGTYDGKRLYGYTCANEIAPDGVPNGIGTFVHEFSHVLGLPDLYNISNPYDTSTPSEYDVMDYGPYVNDGRTPPSYSAVERNAMGWMFPEEFSTAESYSLEPLSESNEAYIIPTNKDNEFFMVENRQKIGWDKYLPGHGMLIWHVTFNQSVWDSNNPSGSKPVGVDLVEAGGSANSRNPAIMAKYPFPGTANVKSFTADTTPALKANDGSRINFPITNIVESNGIISFDMLGGRIEFDTPEAPVLNATDKGTIVVSWSPIERALDYQLNVTCEGKPFGYYTDYNVGNVTEHTISGIDSELDYAVSMRALNGNYYSEYSPEAFITAPIVDFIYRTVKNPEAETTGNTATLRWNTLTDAVAYAITVESETEGGTESETHGFGSNDELIIPNGWEWNGTTSDVYRSSAPNLFGNDAPSLKFAKDARILTSDIYESEITNIKFWMVASGASSQSTSTFVLQTRADSDSEWSDIYTVSNLNQYNSKGQSFDVDVPVGMHQLRFLYNKNIGNAGLDDVTVTTISRKYDKIMDRTNVGNVLSYNLEIPAGVTTLRFFVEGINADNKYSKPSVIASVNTGTSSIDNIKSDLNLDITGKTITYQGESGQPLKVFALTGITIAQTVTDANGTASITLPSSGIYIIVTPTGAKKVKID